MKVISLAVNRLRDGHIILILLSLAFFVRLGRALFTAVVNFDAAVYLYQAKAIYYGLWDAVNSCHYPQVTIVPIFTALLYPLIQDWVWSMRAVSIFFGTLTILPLYLLGRLFFDRAQAFLIILVYAVMHVFVSASVEVIRDPPAWFFNAMGLFTFALALKREKSWLFIVSCLFYILAAWNRIESIVLPLVSFAFLIFFPQRAKSRAIVSFVSPLLIIGAAYLLFLSSSHPPNLHRLNDVMERVKEVPGNYQTVRNELTKLSQHPPPGWEKFSGFFQQSRNLLWLSALGIILLGAAEAFNYLFFLMLIVGFRSWFLDQRKDQLTYWLAGLTGATFLVLYVSVIRDWALEPRWLALIAMPALVFMGYGLNALTSWSERKFPRLGRERVILFMALAIMAVSLPRELQFHDRDKTVYIEIGKTIARREGKRSEPVNVSSVGSSGHFVTLYSNLLTPAPACPAQEWLAGLNSHHLPGKSSQDLTATLRRLGIQYFIWEEKKWPSGTYDLLTTYNQREMEIVGSWWHRDTGKIILFALREKEKPPLSLPKQRL